ELLNVASRCDDQQFHSLSPTAGAYITGDQLIKLKLQDHPLPPSLPPRMKTTPTAFTPSTKLQKGPSLNATSGLPPSKLGCSSVLLAEVQTEGSHVSWKS
uniref:Uncharacterized protein n=1 Tax=Sparus aurata TaxID=8175 RepID=A0A671XXV2_SPAAU